MDSFKTAEILRMSAGGNTAWRAFYDTHDQTRLEGVDWEGSTVAERYGGGVGEEWKERLTAKVEGREYVPVVKTATGSGKQQRGGRHEEIGRGDLGGVTPLSSTTATQMGSQSTGRKELNDAFFARKGGENASRPEGLPPSQGGKYAGFGSTPVGGEGREDGSSRKALPGLEELQRDPVAAVSRGWGWFAGVVEKSAKQVNDSYIVPTAQKIAEADLAAQARTTAMMVGQTVQTGAKGAAEGFNRFVEDSGAVGIGGSRGRGMKAPLDESRKDFWDSFGGGEHDIPAGERKAQPSAIGTAAMKNGAYGAQADSKAAKERGDGWEEEDDKWEKF